MTTPTPGRTSVPGLTVRKATAADTERIAELLSGDPGQEAVAVAGCYEAARKFGMALVRLPDSPQGWQHSVVAELEGEVAGIMQGGVDEIDYGLTPSLAWLAFRVFGVGFVSVLGRYRVLQRVGIPHPRDSYYIGEINVAAELRNRGIGGALLDHATAEAKRLGCAQMSLNTTITNPAQHLYERHGFRIVETRTDPEYERMTGIPGRVLMIKELT